MSDKRVRTICFLCGALFVVALCYATSNAQAGRRLPASSEATFPADAPSQTQTPQTQQRTGDAVKTQPSLMTCRCLERAGEFEQVEDAASAASGETSYWRNQLSTPATILSKPPAVYTKQARRHSTAGVVLVRVVLAATGRVTRVEVLKGLPDGLTENAISAACRIKFKPAMKDDRPVAQQVVAEYTFKIYDSPFFLPR
ncbi:MAG: TonB family protein [Pyrinomonadaceae bacterium]|nr:TonB family protein [Pyrinomonadaceae bacterium]